MPENRNVGPSCAAKSAAVDADLQKIIDRWADLSEPIRHAILALVKAGG